MALCWVLFYLLILFSFYIIIGYILFPTYSYFYILITFRWVVKTDPGLCFVVGSRMLLEHGLRKFLYDVYGSRITTICGSVTGVIPGENYTLKGIVTFDPSLESYLLCLNRHLQLWKLKKVLIFHL